MKKTLEEPKAVYLGSVNLRALVRSVCHRRVPTVAKSIGVRKQTIYDYINGKTSMSADTVEKILNYKEGIK